MADYVKAIKKGLNAAAIADANRREIDSVFNELNRQLTEATDGKITAQIVAFSESKPRPNLAHTPQWPYKAICVFNFSLGEVATQLARWHQDTHGYPCKISYGNKEIYCEDKASLENALADMLRAPSVGKVLSKIITLAEIHEPAVPSPSSSEDDELEDC